MVRMSGNNRGTKFADFPVAEALDDSVIGETFVDPMDIEEFWLRWYLRGFVAQGYGKVKFLVGRPGSGKTHLLRHISLTAEDQGYRVAMIDAKVEKISLIDELYRAVAGKLQWPNLIEKTLRLVISEQLGYPEFQDDPSDFITWAERSRGLTATLLRRDLREGIDHFLAKSDFAQDFLLAVRTWADHYLSGDQEGQAEAIRWLRGERLGASSRKVLGLRSDINRRNARAMLVSLVGWLHLLGEPGLLILVDDLDALTAGKRLDDRPYYTRMARDQAYEMIRQLIDESPFTPYLMTIFAGNQSALSNPKTGLPSYPALWARLQTEVQTARPNRFADMVDLDTLWEQGSQAVDLLPRVWNDREVAWPENGVGRESSKTVGLEWGIPRRMVSEVLSARLADPEPDSFDPGEANS